MLEIDKEYVLDSKEIKETIKNNRYQGMVKVNSRMIMTYYKIDEIINKRKSWGNKYIERLSSDLKEYDKGYSYENLNRMKNFALEFSESEILSQCVTGIPWSTLMTIIYSKSKSHKEMLWYINKTYENGWARNMVINQFQFKAYERNLIIATISNSLDTINSDLKEELFKDTYVLDFIDKEDVINEKEFLEKIAKVAKLAVGNVCTGSNLRNITPALMEKLLLCCFHNTKVDF